MRSKTSQFYLNTSSANSYGALLIVLSVFFGLFFSFAASASETTLFTAIYKGKISGFKITGERTLTQSSEGNYHLKAVAQNSFASITEHSKFTQQKNILIPSSYVYTRKILGAHSIQSQEYDWEAKQVRYVREDKPKKNKTLPLSPSVLDPSLYQLMLQADAYNSSINYRYVFAKTHKIKSMEFRKTGETNYKVGKETYKALSFERINQPDKKQTHIVIIPELAYQIASITHVEEDGDESTLRLTDFSFNKNALLAFYESLKGSVIKTQTSDLINNAN